MATIVGKTTDFVARGSIPAERFLTTKNYADPTVRIDGPQIFPAFRALIGGAKHEVDLQTYVWERGSDPTNDILNGLTDLAARRAVSGDREPVVVRFLFDASGLNFGSTIDALPQAWADVEALELDPALVRFELAGFHHLAFGNLHVKTLVVDGKEAIVTGANPQAHHDYAEPWRDAGFHLSGEVAHALQDDFDDAWSVGETWTCGGELGDADACSAPTTPLVHAADEAIYAGGDCLAMLTVMRQADPTIGANQLDSTQDQAFLAAFGVATDAIRMQTPNLNDDAAKRALLAAVRRGVRVDVVLSKSFNDASEVLPGQGGTNDDTVTELYDALSDVPDACDRLRIRWYARDGVPVEGNGVYASHAKYTSIDGAIAIVGTANMDTQSWNNSREVDVVVDDAATTQAWDQQLFALDFDTGVTVDRCR